MVDIEPIANLFFMLADLERRVETKRQVLSDHRSFNSDELFDMIAGNAKSISSRELILFFNINGLTAEVEELKALLKLFDHNSDGILDRAEFKRTVLSQEHTFADRHLSKNSEVPKEIILSLLKIFDAELGGIKEVDKAKSLFHARGFEPLYVYFNALDSRGKGKLDLRDIYEVLTKFRPDSTYTTATRVLRRLDRDNDHKVSPEEWERWFETLLFSEGNVFNALGRNQTQQHGMSPFEGHHQDRDRVQGSNNYSDRPINNHADEISYQMTPQPEYQRQQGNEYPKTSSSLKYSKSPNRQGRPSNYRPNTTQQASRDGTGSKWTETGNRSRSPFKPERGSRIKEVTTVHDRSPARNEKRTYIVRESEDGTEDIEERIYEPIEGTDPNNREQALYRIERTIKDAKREVEGIKPSYYNVSSDKRDSNPFSGSHPKSPEARGDRIAYQQQGMNNYYESPPRGYNDVHSAQKYHKTPGGKAYRDISPMRNFTRNDRFQPDTKKSPIRASSSINQPNQGALEPRYYVHGDKERVVYSPQNQRQSAQKYADQVDGPYRREEIYKRSPQRGAVQEPFGDTLPEITETLGFHDSPQLKEEIITQKETNGGKQINTYIRKVYSKEKDRTSPGQSDIQNSPYRDEDILATTYGNTGGRLTTDFSGQKNLESRDGDFTQTKRVVHQDLKLLTSKTHFQIDNDAQPFNFDDSFQLARTPKLSSNFMMESTREYTELVLKESEKFKLRDNLASKLSKEDKFSSLTDVEKVELIGCLKAKIGLFREVERARIILAENFDFNIADLFFLAKKNSPKSYIENIGISYDEFKGIYDALNIRVEERFVRLVFVRNDLDNDGSLSFHEFSEILGPFTPSLREDMNRRPTRAISSIDEYTSSVKQALDNVLRATAEYEKETDLTREVTQHRLYSLFNLIDQSNKGLLVFHDLKNALELYGSFSNDQEILALIRKFDFNKDGKISMTEFINQMSPLRNSQPYEHIRNKGF